VHQLTNSLEITRSEEVSIHSCKISILFYVGKPSTGNSSSSSAFALYIERFAYYCGFYFAPFRPSNSDFGYIEEEESTAGYTFTPCVGSFACPGIDTQVQGISVLRLI
jgi:hypothetical protein